MIIKGIIFRMNMKKNHQYYSEESSLTTSDMCCQTALFFPAIECPQHHFGER